MGRFCPVRHIYPDVQFVGRVQLIDATHALKRCAGFSCHSLQPPERQLIKKLYTLSLCNLQLLIHYLIYYLDKHYNVMIIMNY